MEKLISKEIEKIIDVMQEILQAIDYEKNWSPTYPLKYILMKIIDKHVN